MNGMTAADQDQSNSPDDNVSDISSEVVIEPIPAPKKKRNETPLLLPHRHLSHHPKTGINPLVDAASFLFSLLGELQNTDTPPRLKNLHNELIQEMNHFVNTIKDHGDNSEYAIVCRYILCATFDEIISNTAWGNEGQWDNYSLLASYNQDIQHQDKFFIILERAVKEPALYIDLMELMYLCLSMGYQGKFRGSEIQHQLEQVTNYLYKHIRAYRGNFSKSLAPALKSSYHRLTKSAAKPTVLFICITTACIAMAMFISLGYLMDNISHESYKRIAQIENSISHENFES
jgi:type VI secretion system protein ImpK